jgi:hypothetical protein
LVEQCTERWDIGANNKRVVVSGSGNHDEEIGVRLLVIVVVLAKESALSDDFMRE